MTEGPDGQEHPVRGRTDGGDAPADAREQALFSDYLARLHRRTDRMFALLLVVQYAGAVVAAIVLSPLTWAGADSSTHTHLWAAVLLGGVLVSLPLYLIATRPGAAVTRHTVAVAQMMFSALFIHLSAGRIETHFHVFGSLAFLALYRDWRVLIPATLVVVADHLIRGLYWPWSVFGVATPAPWRALEHAGWVLFEDTVLIYGCVQGVRQLRTIASAQAASERAFEQVETQVRRRTAELEERTAELRASEERFALAVRGTSDGLWDWDLRTDRIYYAPRWCELLGLEPGSVGDSPGEWFGRIASGNLSSFHDRLTAHVEGQDERLDLELEMNHSDGRPRWMLCRAAAIREVGGRAVRLAGSLTDITELKLAQENLRRLAQHDRLTGLPNRSLFKDRLRQVMAEARAEPGRVYAVLFFDFDRFKLINDSLGHDAGDALLIGIAERFRSVLRAGDVASRFGGDEFVVLLARAAGPEEIRATTERLLAEFARPHQVAGRAVVSTASIGLAISTLGYDDPDDMIRDADVAMYQAKMDGRGAFREFDATMHAKAVSRLNLEQDIMRADPDREFELHYQPIYSLATGEPEGVEALLRWNHPTLGPVEPSEFIGAAEDTGAIIRIGAWVAREVCRQIRAWEDGHGVAPPVVNVNLSRRQLIEPGLPELLAAAASEHRVDPARVCIEITETDIMDERNAFAGVLERIRALGFGLAMDDFGTGHSSLWCLHKFPLDALKIDRSFVRHMAERREFTAVMQAIVSLSHNLNLRVVAEGVETEDQLAQLQALDCESAQGYLLGRPVPAGQVPGLLRSGRPRRAA